MRSNPVDQSFNAGEISPRLAARTDFQKYKAALETAENVIPLPEGGLMRRAGTRYIAALKSSSVLGKLKRFEFSETQAYVIEMGASIFRFYRYQGQILAANVTAAAIVNGTFAADIASWTDRDTGGTAASTWNSAGYAQLLGDGTEYAWLSQTITGVTNNEVISLQFQIIGAPGDEVLLRVGTTATGGEIVSDKAFKVGYHVYTFTATATTIYIGFRTTTAKALGFDNVAILDNAALELQTPYAEADLPTIFGPQSADVLYLFHPDYPGYKLERLANTSWSLVEVAWQDGPWLAENDTATTLTFSAATGLGVTVTASAITGINDGEGFKSTDVGRLIRLTDNTTVNWGWAVITAFTSTTVVTADVKRTVVVATAETKWRLGAWSGTTGYPRCAAFYEQRLFAAGTTDQPHSFWGSQSADFENMSPDSANSSGVWNATVEDDDALDYTISSDQVQAIIWMSPGEDTLVIGTASGEWTPSSAGAVLTPSDITVRQQTNHGSANIAPVRVDHVVLFVQKAERKLQEFGFSFDVNGYRAFDMTRLAQHITRGGIVQMDYAEEQGSLVAAVRNDGQLLLMTYRREEDVVGWSRSIIGGSFQGGDAVVESVVVIPGADGTGSGQIQDSTSRDEIWLIVKRTIDEVTKRYIEVIERDHETGDAQEDSYYSDSLITLDNSIAITAATKADPVVVTAGTHGLSNGDTIRTTDVVGMTELNTNSYVVGVVDADNVRLMDPDVVAYITAATQANPVVITVLDGIDDIANADVIGITGVSGMTQLNGNVYTVANKNTANKTFELSGVNGTGYGAYTSGGSVYDSTDGTAFTTYISGGKLNKKVTAISGLSHLEGETVKILGDGAIMPDETVASGAITLDSAVSVAQIGLAYSHKIKTLKFEGGTAAGTAIGKPKQVFGITFVVLNSHTVNFGRDADNLDKIDFREVSDAMDAAVPFYTGERFVEFAGDWNTDSRIYIEDDDPVPFTLLAMAPEIDIREMK